MYLYVSGPIANGGKGNIPDNVKQGAEIGYALTKMGHSVICPHLNSYYEALGIDISDMDWDGWLRADEIQIARCDALVMTPDWQTSKGAVREYNYAMGLGMPIYVAPDLPPLHPTEVRCPDQAQAFAEICGQLYRTHLKKNADYSPANILGTGQIGLVTRLWDKVARLLNLYGFKIDISRAWFEMPREPQNESLDDSWLDAAVYSIIGILVRRGLWGH